jgi:hypothetical protein
MPSTQGNVSSNGATWLQMVEERYRAFLIEHLRVQDIRHSGRNFFAHLKGTHDLLRDWGAPEFVCVAGLFHSIYGTWHFRHKAFPIEQRSVLRNLIGSEAEYLAYVFCVTERPKVFLDNVGRSEISIRDHYTNAPIQLRPEDLSNLLEIEAANLIEQGSNAAGMRRLRKADISGAAKASIARYLENCMAT